MYAAATKYLQRGNKQCVMIQSLLGVGERQAGVQNRLVTRSRGGFTHA